ncbi:mitochondrial import inner membrane translocase subunit Tim23-like [Mercenaria mercenaria]|uniref:mitochondrial import inner membrane translocase subunit Tim23-like n=1 Tax=Mercenaria mercenaria TaxID=6596 RepID=UPI00234E5F85|nr:mitochondrial import inner membrane translocase subunit Tim23-like [Mercenaria mercenaria]
MTENKSFGGFFGSSDPDLNIPVKGTAGLSPYMNLDPTLISDNENYILSEGAGGHHRGKFEKAFSQIGGCVFVGGALGGANGIYTGLKETKGLQGSVKRTQMLNFIAKQGASSAQAFGTVAFMYSAIDTSLSLLGSPDEDLNTVISGTATGLLYKSTAGLKGLRVGGAVGLGLSLAYCCMTSPRIWSNY